MKVSQLITELQRQDPEMEVRFEFPAHDYWRSNLAALVVQVEPSYIEYDGYHEQFRMPREELSPEDVRERDHDDCRKAVILRGYRR